MVIIPSTITSIGFAPFYNSGLTHAYFEEPEGWKLGASGQNEDISFSDPTTAAITLKSNSSISVTGFTRS